MELTTVVMEDLVNLFLSETVKVSVVHRHRHEFVECTIVLTAHSLVNGRG